jgi:hypothetical protein
VELRGIELEGHGPLGLEDETIPLLSSRRGRDPITED